jgi:predicted GNAT family N-acyltransferase
MNTEVTVVSTAEERVDAYQIRMRVFVREQGVPAGIELDEHDTMADHLLGRVDGEPMGTVRLLAGGPGVGFLGRLAVLPEARGTGLGAALVRAVEDLARERELKTVELHAQVEARGFYERLGYEAYGEEDISAGIPHIWMRKTVSRDETGVP